MKLYELPTRREDFLNAHKYSAGNRDALKKDKVCGCFYCGRIFSPSEIDNWIEERGGTALCPYCGIDAVIGESSGYTICDEFLQSMKKFWF